MHQVRLAIFPDTSFRARRRDAAPWLAVVLLIPLLMFGSFNRATFVAHGHDGHGVHLHPAEIADRGKLTANIHAEHHGHDHASLPSDVPAQQVREGDAPDEAPDCFIVYVDSHENLMARDIGLGKAKSTAVAFAIVASVLPPTPDLAPPIGSPGGAPKGGPMSLRGLSAGDRLVRTSRALLI